MTDLDLHETVEGQEVPVTVSLVIDAVGWVPGTLTAIAGFARVALGDTPSEILVATGLGVESDELEVECRSAGIRHIPFDTDHRPATAMNNAAAAASGRHLVLLEEDFVLARRSLAAALEHLSSTGSDVAVLEGRDGVLPMGSSIHDLDRVPLRRYLESVPRTSSNRGAVMVLTKEQFLRVRGYDERPSLEPHLSIDLFARLSRAGLLVDRLSGPRFAAYHFFGPTCVNTARHGIESARVRANHHDVVEEDRTIYRNLASWSVPRPLRSVLVSVAVSTRNRCDYLEDSIDSVLAQTFEDFELIIVDDGSTDRTREVVEGYADPRVKYLYQDPSGISAARNLAADHSQGFFTAVHDDDDIMLPWRLETSLQNIQDEYGASYGSWANFDDDTGDMVLHVIRRGFSPELNAFNGQGPGHATWLLPTAAVREARYDEHLSSSVDHNLASRLAWSGLRWKHTEKVMFLRRIHPTQVSAVDGGRQRTTSVLTRFANRFTTSEPGRRKMVDAGSELTNPVIPEAKSLVKSFGPYLPDHLVHRTLVLANNVTNKVIDLDLYQKVGSVLAEHDLHTGKLRLELGELPGITWKDLVTLRESGIIGTRLEASLRTPEEVADLRAAAFTAAASGTDDLAAGGATAGTEQAGVSTDRTEVPGEGRARELVLERLAYHASVLRKKSPTSLWLVARTESLEESELEILRTAHRAYDIRASGDLGTRFGVLAFGCEQSKHAVTLISQVPEAVESGRLTIGDAENQPAEYTAQLLQEALRGATVEDDWKSDIVEELEARAITTEGTEA